MEPSATPPEDHTVVSAKDWAQQADRDTQLFYGPNGDGTAGFIPTAAYTLLAICLILVVAAVGNRESLLSFFAPLRILGRSERSIQSAAFWTVLIPYLGAIIAAVLAVFWYTTIAYVVTTGTPGAWMPFMPIGLWVLFGAVFLATSASAYLPTAEHRAPRSRVHFRE